MDSKTKLFWFKELYDHENSNSLFMNAVKENVRFHSKHCKEYANILKMQGFQLNELNSISDLYRLPPIPTLYLKQHRLVSLPAKKLMLHATSSGTSGAKSYVSYELNALILGASMVKRIMSYHRLWSPKPTNTIILGYEPSASNQTIISKTAYCASWLTPSIHREYALKQRNGNYELDFSRIMKKIRHFSQQPFPVRIIGFPSYLYFMLKKMKQYGIYIKLPKDSMILLGGGWKQYTGYKIDKSALYELVQEHLGIVEQNCKEFFGVAEHPMIYCDCKHHHFHIPAYSRVLIRDVSTLEPVPNGTPGILNLITPLLDSVPFVSILTDDLAVLHDGCECGCGIAAPYFEVLGRIGIQEIKTCTAGANEKLQKGGRL